MVSPQRNPLLEMGAGMLRPSPKLDALAKLPMMQGALTAGMLGVSLPTAAPKSDWIAYHGSPHKFDKFSLEHIGKGEGAQAYGQGLYFADNPGVAIDYKANLSKQSPERLRYDGNVIRGDSIYSRSLEDMALLGKPAALQKIDDNIRFNEKYAPDMAELYRSARKQIESVDPSKIRLNQGYLYKVDIDDARAPKEAFLDWDKPLSQQSESVRKFFEPIVAPIRHEMSKPAGKGWGDLAAPTAYDPTGRELLSLLRKPTGGVSDILSNGLGPGVSAMLLKNGIPGIRYLDAGSRANGGTHNTVLFDDSLVKILERQ
jgi:hypothetical protein